MRRQVKTSPSSLSISRQRGVALMLVIFVVSMASILTVSLTRSSFVTSRYQQSARQRLQAEYLLKSALNFSRALISTDLGDSDPPRDKLWGMFSQGNAVPLEMLGVSIPQAVLSLEIRAEDGKLPIQQLKDSGSMSAGLDLFLKWRGVFEKFFNLLGFDSDGETAKFGPTKGEACTSQQTVANLIDYMDADNDSYDGGGSFASGIESRLGDEKFPNREPDKLADLLAVPCFSEARLRKMASHVMVLAKTTVNVNYASRLTLEALDPQLNSDGAKAIVDYVNKTGPFNKDTYDSVLPDMMPNFADLRARLIGYRTRYFQIVAKLQIGDRSYFMRANVSKPPPGEREMPAVLSYEFIG